MGPHSAFGQLDPALPCRIALKIMNCSVSSVSVHSKGRLQEGRFHQQPDHKSLQLTERLNQSTREDRVPTAANVTIFRRLVSPSRTTQYLRKKGAGFLERLEWPESSFFEFLILITSLSLTTSVHQHLYKFQYKNNQRWILQDVWGEVSSTFTTSQSSRWLPLFHTEEFEMLVGSKFFSDYFIPEVFYSG